MFKKLFKNNKSANLIESQHNTFLTIFLVNSIIYWMLGWNLSGLGKFGYILFQSIFILLSWTAIFCDSKSTFTSKNLQISFRNNNRIYMIIMYLILTITAGNIFVPITLFIVTVLYWLFREPNSYIHEEGKDIIKLNGLDYLIKYKLIGEAYRDDFDLLTVKNYVDNMKLEKNTLYEMEGDKEGIYFYFEVLEIENNALLNGIKPLNQIVYSAMVLLLLASGILMYSIFTGQCFIDKNVLSGLLLISSFILIRVNSKADLLLNLASKARFLLEFVSHIILVELVVFDFYWISMSFSKNLLLFSEFVKTVSLQIWSYIASLLQGTQIKENIITILIVLLILIALVYAVEQLSQKQSKEGGQEND